MTLSINISSKIFIIFSALTLLWGCSSAINKPGTGEISEPYRSLSIAVLPVSNLSRTSAPVNDIRRLATELLREHGLDVLDEEDVDDFLMRHRIRYVNGINRVTSRAFSNDTGAGAVLVVVLEHYDKSDPPKIAITYRLIRAGKSPEILWSDSVGLAGDDTPGLLELGVVRDPGILTRNALEKLTNSLSGYVSVDEDGAGSGTEEEISQDIAPEEHSYETENFWDRIYESREERFEPKLYHRSPSVFEKDKEYTVAVLPFFNRSGRKYAGEIIEMHFVRELSRLPNLTAVEPGVVRDTLLKSRVIMYGGISLDNVMVISSMLDADFVLTGTVLDYEDYRGAYGVPRVDFSVMLIEGRSREAVWTSKSYNEGDDSVFFFDVGKVNTAHSMATEMTRAVAAMMFSR